MKYLILTAFSFCLMGISTSFAGTNITLKCTPSSDINWALERSTVLQLEISSTGEILSGEIDGVKVENDKDSLHLPNRNWYYSFETSLLRKLRTNQPIDMTIIGADYLASFNVDVPCRRIR